MSQKYQHSLINCSIIHNCQDMEIAHVSVNRWMDKVNAVYTDNGILFSPKKERNLSTCNNINEPEEQYDK